MQINQLHPRFFGEITGLDTSVPASPETIEAFEAAMAKYAVCVIRGASTTDEDHIRFSRSFGSLEYPPPEGGRISEKIFDVGNLTPDGKIRPYNPDGPQPADFERFHTDSPFNSYPTKWSLLLAYVVPPEGANTEYIDTRAVYEDLSQEMKDRIDNLQAQHNMFIALERYGVKFGDENMRKSYPTMSHPLVRESASGRKALYIGWHAIGIDGWNDNEGRELLDELYVFATRREFVYSHKWTQGDMVVWDNRCSMHCATPFDRYKYKRDMRRTTINEYGPEVSTIQARDE